MKILFKLYCIRAFLISTKYCLRCNLLLLPFPMWTDIFLFFSFEIDWLLLEEKKHWFISVRNLYLLLWGALWEHAESWFTDFEVTLSFYLDLDIDFRSKGFEGGFPGVIVILWIFFGTDSDWYLSVEWYMWWLFTADSLIVEMFDAIELYSM